MQEKAINCEANASQQWSCIVFVDQKIACFAIGRLLKACQEQLSFLRVTSLMGNSGHISGLAQSIAVGSFADLHPLFSDVNVNIL